MATWESNGHVIDDVTWPWNVKVLTPMLLEANISKTAGDIGFVPKDRQQVGNGLCRVDDVTYPVFLFVTQCVFHATFRSIKLLGNVEKQQI